MAYASLISEKEGAMRLVKGAFNLIQDRVVYARQSANVTFDMQRGTVVHLNSAGEYETGATSQQPPLYLWVANDAAQVSNPGVTQSGTYSHSSGMTKVPLMAFPALAGLEIEITNFDAAQTYAINDYLRSPTDNATKTVGGRLTNRNVANNGKVKPYTDPVCGYVAAPKRTNDWGHDVLRVWTYFLPQLV